MRVNLPALLCVAATASYAQATVAPIADETEVPTLKPASKRGFEEPKGIAQAPTERRIARFLRRWKPRNGTLSTVPDHSKRDGETLSSKASASSEQHYRGRVFSAANAFDGDFRSAWVEDETGNGHGAWIEIEFPAPARVEGGADKMRETRLLGLMLVSGFARNRAMFRRNPRPSLLLATLSCSESVEPSDAGLETASPEVRIEERWQAAYHLQVADTRRPQLFVFGPKHRQALVGSCRLRLEVEQTLPGTRSKGRIMSDTSIAEARLVFEVVAPEQPLLVGDATQG